MQFELITLDGIKFSKKVHEVQLPTPGGIIGVFPNHSPLVSVAATGVIEIRHQPNDPDSLLEYFAINGGAIEITEGRVRVLVDEADHGDEVNEQEAQKAYERAQQLRREAKDQVSLDKAQDLVDRQAVRLKVADLKRRTRRG